MTIPIPRVPTDLRLIVTDMDGTLLDESKRTPDSLWPLLDELTRRGIVFGLASGRQAATLPDQLGHAVPGLVVIAENGSVVARGDEMLHVAPLDAGVGSVLVRSLLPRSSLQHDMSLRGTTRTAQCGRSLWPWGNRIRAESSRDGAEDVG
ncbi:HAD hydrolase family protein [Gordonia sp. CPCC 206044]|uniref:HAD hydrolase family protein n=1 Tax=Gordonia sp. CPCC 206044 TaxID=3140793 RepID=UPI003AF36A3F